MSITRKTLAIFTLGSFTSSTGWALYYTLSRIDLKIELNAGYTGLMLLVAAESLAGIASILWGYLGDKLGGRRMVSIGILSIIPFALLGLLRKPRLFIMMAALATILHSASVPSVLAVLVSEEEKSGRRLGLFGGGSSAGWAFGSFLMAPIDGLGGPAAVYLLSAALIGLSLLIFSKWYPQIDVTGESSSWEFVRKLPLLILSISIIYFGLLWAFTVLSIKLYYELGGDKMLFAIFYGGLPALIGSIIEPGAGVIADRVGGFKLLIFASAAYIVLMPLLYLSSGMLMAMLWLAPIYPFYYVSVGKTYSDLAPPDLKATSMGAANTAYSLGGLASGFTGILTDIYGIGYTVLLSVVVMVGGISILLIGRPKKSTYK